jgi:hypothetical protein
MNQLKKAFESAEQEIQDKEIASFKEIVLRLLEKKKELDEEKSELEKEIKVVRQTIDDFKEGRLDKVKEMLEKNEEAKKILPLQIVIIQNDNWILNPLKPWNWNYQLTWQPRYDGLVTYSNDGMSNVFPCMSANLIGTTASNFTSGTYNLSNGNSISL